MSVRAEAVESTRARIVEAAAELYRMKGITNTTVGEVAQRADVARATVLNHFGGRESLAKAAIERLVGSLDIPTPAIFEGSTGVPDRLRRLVSALYGLYDRSEPLFTAFRDELQKRGPLRRREKRFWGQIRPLYDAALGPQRRNRRLLSTVAGLTSPATLAALKAAGLSMHEAAEVVGDLLAGLARA